MFKKLFSEITKLLTTFLDITYLLHIIYGHLVFWKTMCVRPSIVFTLFMEILYFIRPCVSGHPASHYLWRSCILEVTLFMEILYFGSNIIYGDLVFWK